MKVLPMSLLAGMLLLPAVLHAQAGADPEQAKTFYACYVPGSGSVYRIRESGLPDACGKTGNKQHVEFSWSESGSGEGVVGPQGPEGPVGPEGPTGPQGEQGIQGPAGSGGTSIHNALSGLTSDDHPQYLLTQGVRNSPNGFAVTGAIGQGNIPATGPGVRMMWFPRKAAFRAGQAFADEWDDAKIGSYSVAMGYRTLASAGAATAMGIFTTASGQRSTAMGSSTTASGGYSTALGDETTASGERSTAMGYATTASGSYSTAMGVRTIASGAQSSAMGTRASTSGRTGAFVYGDASPTATNVNAQADNQFVVRAQRFWFGTNNNVTATAGRYIETSTGAYLTTGGTWVNSSDASRKTGFEPVDGEETLSRLASLPITTWSYRDEDASVRHLGPTAQDFHAGFGLGDTDKAIATVDADGVSLAAIQALEKRTRGLPLLRTDVEGLSAENAALRAALAELAQRLSAIESQR